MTNIPIIFNMQVATLITLAVMLIGGGVFLGKIVQLQKDHEKLDDERFRTAHKRFDTLNILIERRPSNLIILFFVLALATPAQAFPTPTAKTLAWNHSGEDLAGFYLYWAMESEVAPRVYGDTRRIKISDPFKRSIVLLSVKADAKDRMCFKMTAFDAVLPVGNESGFSGEACGYFGFEAVTGFGVE